MKAAVEITAFSALSDEEKLKTVRSSRENFVLVLLKINFTQQAHSVRAERVCLLYQGNIEGS